MNNVLVTAIFLMCGQLLFGINSHAQHDISINISGISASKGKLMLALFNRAEGFPDNGSKAYLVKEIAAQKGKISLKLENLPAATYALAVFHDANNDGKLNTNLVGIPKEDYGFSNNARPGFRAPTFKEAAIRVSTGAAIDILIR